MADVKIVQGWQEAGGGQEHDHDLNVPIVIKTLVGFSLEVIPLPNGSFSVRTPSGAMTIEMHASNDMTIVPRGV